MTFADKLKSQLSYFVESYRRYFLRTYVVAMTVTILCYVASAVLIRYGKSDFGVDIRNIADLFFYHYSVTSYELVDLSLAFWLFFITLFSIALVRIDKEEAGDEIPVSFGRIIGKISFQDIGGLIVVLTVSCLLDFLLFEAYNFQSHKTELPLSRLNYYLYYLLVHFRQYIPLLLYGIVTYLLLGGERLAISFKGILFLFLSLWLFNSLAFDFFVWVRDLILGLILIRFDKDGLLILYESLVSIPVIGFFFIGYYSALTSPLKIWEDSSASEQPEQSLE